MSYQVIARKYRPQRFSDVVGQEHVTQTLSHAIQQKRIAHGYLFCGPRGTGKTTIARIFAKCLNCTDGPKVEFNDEDPRCQEIAEGRSLDVLEIDGASNNGVEQVRELRDTCKYAPASSRFKIYIIDEVHMLSTAAFNALLKTLEEPPAHVKFMFATTDPEKVLPTILSRCQRFDLRRIPALLIGKHLAQIAKQERVEIDGPALHAIARGAEGAMRDAESTLDQLISFCGAKIQEQDVLSMFGLTSQSHLLDLARCILTGNSEGALRQLNELASNGKDLGRLISDLLNHFRNLLIFQVSRGDLNLIEASEAELAALAEQSKMASTEGLTRVLEVFADVEMRLRDAASKKILVEVALIKAIEARNAISVDAVLNRLRSLRDAADNESSAGLANSASVQPTVRSAPTEKAPRMQDAGQTKPATVPGQLQENAPVAPLACPDNELWSLWRNLIEAVGRVSPFTRTYLLEAHPVSFVKNLFTVGFGPEVEDHLGLVDNARNHTLLQTKFQELGHPNVQLKFIKAEPPTVPSPPVAPLENIPPTPPIPASATAGPPPAPPTKKVAPVSFNKDDFKNDPLIQAALEIFKGQIIEVRA